MTRKLMAAAVALTVVATTYAQRPTQPQQRIVREQPTTLKMLNTRLGDVRFVETPFEQVMNWLADVTDSNLVVRWQILEDNGIDRDTPISVQVKNLRFSQVLSLIIGEAGGSDLQLAYRASGKLIVVSTNDDLSQEMITKIYDVSDLLVRLPRASLDAAFDVTQGLGQNTTGGGGGGGGGAGGGMFGQGGNQQNQQDYDNQGGAGSQMAQIVDIIRQTIEPDSWRENNGKGSITAFRQTLIVHNSILVHQKLGGYVTEAVAGP
jgi:hypothetical protein